MVSPNTFLRRSRSAHERDDRTLEGERSGKRLRLSSEEAAIQTQCAQAETALEVDVMILDYLAYKTIAVGLRSHNPKLTMESPSSLRHDLPQTNAFLSVFKARHSSYKPDPELRFRILLLKLVTLFARRLTRNHSTPPPATISSRRAQHQDQARRWIGSAERLPTARFQTGKLDSDLPISPEGLEQNRAHMLKQIGVPAEDEAYEDPFYGTSASVSLLDLLPLFMHVSAARNTMSGSNLTVKWMELAGDFMLQACLEQYLIFGAHGSDAIDEAFAWGYKLGQDNDIEMDAEGSSAEDEVNEMFQDEDYLVELKGWSDAKAYYLGELLPGAYQNGSLVAHLESLAAEHPLGDFENRLLVFLTDLAGSIPEPVLAQLEKGKLDGLTVGETWKFVQSCGLSTARFFEAPVGFKGAGDCHKPCASVCGAGNAQPELKSTPT